MTGIFRGSGSTSTATEEFNIDGDKGDIVVTNSGDTWTIDTGVVNTTKLGGDITTAGKALLDDANASAQRTTLGLGTLAVQNGTFSGTSSNTNTGDQNLFQTIAVSGQSDVVADSTTDTLNLVAGINVTITTDPLTDSITIASASASGVPDGDKGDIVVSSAGTVWTIDNDAVTYAKIQDVSATNKLLGRSTAGAGNVEEIACTAAGRALLDDVDASAQRTTLGLGTAATTNSTDYATALQGATADTALQPADIGVSVQAWDADLDTWATKTAPTGTVVGTTDSQVLTNKTISTDDNTISGIAASSFVLSNASGNVDGTVAQKAIPSGVVVGTTDSQTLTNKTINASNNTITNVSLTTGVTGVLPEANGGTGTSTGNYMFKNRIINGAMMIDQRNSGASVSIPLGLPYITDRFAIGASLASKLTAQQNAGSVTPPAGFSNYLGATSSSAYSVLASDYFYINQRIEANNLSDLAYGTASASSVTLSFWARSSLTGTFGGALFNSTGNKSYAFTYTISSANTWEYKTVTILGDTTTALGTGTGIGLLVSFGLGAGSTYSTSAGSWQTGLFVTATGATSVVGTNGATFYITGVQLEKGSTATSFDYRPYGTELALCQRYYWKWVATSPATYLYTGLSLSTLNIYGPVKLPVTMRASPTLTTSGTASDYGGYQGGSIITCNVVPSIDTSNPDTPLVIHQFSGGLTVGYSSIMGSRTANGFLGFNAEL